MSCPLSLRRTTVIAMLAVAWLLSSALVAQPAQAHGALSSPVSRAMACGREGGAAATSAACKATIAASGGSIAFDNVRVPDVNGRDRQLIPDGKLCSGGLPQFKGLDLVRTDWPATTLTAGAAFTFRYRVTIPHAGSFRLYATRAGYSPTHALRWSDLAAQPFLTATNPMIQGGAYVLRGSLPAGLTGRHIIYAIWQTTSTPDTYYSCSDVVFTSGAGAAAAPARPASAMDAAPATSAATDAGPMLADPRTAAATSRDNPVLPILLAIGVGLVAAAVLVVVRYRRLDLARQATRTRVDSRSRRAR